MNYFQDESRIWMSDEYHQKMVIQHYLIKMASSAFHSHYSNIPLFHHSMWFTEENGHQKNYNSPAAAG